MAVRRTVTVVNPKGLHARPAAKFVACAEQFNAQIYVRNGDLKSVATSIMGLLVLAAVPGTDLTLIAKGPEAKPALEALAALVEDGFGELEGS